MIYRNSYFKKEMQRNHIDYQISLKNTCIAGAFMGIFAFSMHFMLQIVYESVLTEAFPQLMQPSYYSVLLLYNLLMVTFEAIYLIVGYEHLTFYEIRNNKWYTMVKMGHSVTTMTGGKIVAVTTSTVLRFVIGFFTCLGCTAFLKYTFIADYVPTMLIKGCMDVLLVVIFTCATSVFVKYRENERYIVLISVVFLIFLQMESGFITTFNNRVAVQSLSSLLSGGYVLVWFLVCSVCVVACFWKAKQLCSYVHIDAKLPEGVVIHNSQHGQASKESKRYIAKLIDILIYTVTIGVIVLGIACNTLMLIVSISTPGNEVTVFGYIPYIFASTTMSPTIEKNDLAFFTAIENSGIQLKEGDVVLFMAENRATVSRIKSIESDGTAWVDIDNYPALAQTDAMLKNVEISQIYGVFAMRNRWLGAIIMFANTLVGRIIFLLLPVVLLFYHKAVFEKLSKMQKRSAV